MELLFFGSKKCPKCSFYRDIFSNLNISHTYIDALSPYSQDICDKYDVNKLPHFLVVSENQIVYNLIGKQIDILLKNNYLKNNFSKKEKNGIK